MSKWIFEGVVLLGKKGLFLWEGVWVVKLDGKLGKGVIGCYDFRCIL